MALIETICGKSISRFASTVMLVLCPVILLACGPSSSSNGEPPVEQMAIRSPHPTFTPTPLDAAPPPPPAPSTLAADAPPQDSTAVTPSTNAAATQPAAPKAKLVINAEAVNLREGPSTDATIITMLLQGQEFDIIGKDATGKWWFICCSEDKAGWVTSEFADVSGPVDQIPVVADDATGPLPTAQVAVAVDPPTATPQPVAVANPPTDTPLPPAANPAAEATATEPAQGGPVSAATSSFEFDLVAQEQFPETNVVRIFLYVFDDKAALEGYSLKVTKDGAELPVEGASFGPNTAYTWPVADPRQRAQNFKVEFPTQNPAGAWEAQLMRDGVPVGPSATFTLVAGDQNRELYVRYQRR